MFNDLKDAVKSRLYERIADPLLGTYTLGLITWNWQPICILLAGDGSIFVRILFVSVYYFDSIESKILALTLPLLISLLYVFGYPWLKLVITKYDSWMKSEIRIQKESYDRRRRLTVEQSVAMQVAHEQELTESQKIIKQIQVNFEAFREFVLNSYRVLRSNDGVTNVQLLRCAASIKVGTWVRNADGFAVPTLAENNPSLAGVVALKLGDEFCIVQANGSIRDAFKDLLPGATYFLSPADAGAMTSVIAKPYRGIQLGVAKAVDLFSIEIVHTQQT